PAPAAGAKASPAAPEAPLKRSEDLVVSATRTEQSVTDLPVSVTVVPRETIEETPAHNLSDALRTVVGLNLPLPDSNLAFPTTNRVSMRGLGGTRALVLLDGVPLNDPLAGYVQWGLAPMLDIEKVEVVRGSGASLFGNYAMGGTVSLATRPLDRATVDADLSYGSLDTWGLNAAVTESLGSGIAAGIFVDAGQTDGYIRMPPADRGAIDIASWAKGLDVLAKVEATASDGSKAWLRGNFMDHDTGQGTPVSKTWQQIWDVAGGGRLVLGKSDLKANVFYQHATFSIDNSLLVTGAGRDQEYLGSHSERPGETVGGSVQWSLPLPGLVTFVTAGLDSMTASMNEKNVSYNRAGQQTGTRDIVGNQTFAGLFAEADFRLLPDLEALLSARLDAWRNSGGQETVTPGGVTSYPAASTTQLDPRLALKYRVSDAVSLRGAVYRAFRAPTLADLYRGSSSRTQVLIPNPDLGPETLVGGDVGTDIAAGPFTGQVNLFLNRVEGLIARAALATTPVLVVQPRNLGATRSAGVEFMGTVALSKALFLDLGYAFTDAVITDNPADPTLVGKHVPDVPRNAGSFALRFDSPAGVTGTVRGRALSQIYGDEANKTATDAHFVLDVLLSYRILPTLEILGRAENLLNASYVSDVNLGPRLGPPQQFFIGLRLRQPVPRLGRSAGGS
ncbi:MAG TPA: TonB-dependent receptor, partial [Thermoanaerobaculia bacterium]|nr:TonB-dependent receptor [Thermoanaerobaculia bacterium]